MITKYRVSNKIVMRGETDVAPPLLHLMEKENTAHKGTETRCGEITNIGVVFDAPPPALPIHTNTNGKNYKKDYCVFSFLAALFAPHKYGGVVLYYSSAINGGTGSVS